MCDFPQVVVVAVHLISILSVLSISTASLCEILCQEKAI